MADQADTPVRYELSWTFASAASSCHGALEEIGCAYELRFVDLSQPVSEAYRVLNPHGKVPVLIDRGDGGETPLVLYPSAAILMHLADAHPKAGLLPPPGTAARAQATQWLFRMAEMLQPAMMMLFYPERHTTAEDEASRAAAAQMGVRWTRILFEQIDAEVGAGPYLLGDAFSVCDLYLLTMAMWNRRTPEFMPINDLTHLTALIDRVAARPAVERMLASHFPD